MNWWIFFAGWFGRSALVRNYGDNNQLTRALMLCGCLVCLYFSGVFR